AKNEQFASGQDRGWVDQVQFQPGGATCPVTLSQSSATHASWWETGKVSVAAAIGCQWSVVRTASWIYPTLSEENGQGVVHYWLAPNLTSESRAGTILIAGQPFTVLQL